MSDSSMTTPRTGLSLYADLLDPDTKTPPGTISKGPIAFKSTQTSNEPKKSQIDLAALRFQPNKRPQLLQKIKAKSSFPKPTAPEAKVKGNPHPQVALASAPSSSTVQTKTTLADWTTGGDEETFYGADKRQRGGRKRKKKNKEEHTVTQDWDDIYDPTRPNNFEEYKHSDERVREVREWKDRLYAHREAREIERKGSEGEEPPSRSGQSYVPPPNYNFAPPPLDISTSPTIEVPTSQPKISPAPKVIDQEESLPPSTLPPGSISRAPIRYNFPPPPSDIPSSEAELQQALGEEVEQNEPEAVENSTRSRRPGQKGFAERLMSKYGWSKGKGLGAEETGIVNPLQVKLEKRKKKSDAEGGGFRDPGGRGKIIGGNKNASSKDQDSGKFGPMSEVIMLRGMVDGMDLDNEVEGAGDGGLIQEIGDECAEKYGRVERVYIHRKGSTPLVFVKFTSQLSALRAVNALEGRMFNGNTIAALFYDSDKFEGGIYD
ncbi:hypothetical protein K3495_g4869 [Podosphaera aphanis]|nr:hypothetical protein K3495_g4869 [Podosphaera aphanis]